MLKLRRMGIDSHQQAIVYLHAHSHVCRAEGFRAETRVELAFEGRRIVASLNVVNSDLVETDQAALSEEAWQALAAREEGLVAVSHAAPVNSMCDVRLKLHGGHLEQRAIAAIVADVAGGRYLDVEIAAFVAGCVGDRLDLDETIATTVAMASAGDRLRWPGTPVMDKHSVGGLPGNRTTPIVVAIVAAAGLTIPKTSSRAITSPAGTADTMATLAPVNLSTVAMRRVVEREGGCIVWAGAMNLSPADDSIIRIERPLDLDSEGLLVASVLSKKVAAGSTHVVIDLPIGPTAKVRSPEAARRLANRFGAVGAACGISVEILPGDGRQPIGQGIGPALEARDVLAVLRNDVDAPARLRSRALELATQLIAVGRSVSRELASGEATRLLESGAAHRKFEAVCAAQGGMRTPPVATFRADVLAAQSGRVVAIDNRRLARAAKLAGAPAVPSAGIRYLAPVGMSIGKGEPLMEIHADHRGELDYALAYLHGEPDIVVIDASA